MEVKNLQIKFNKNTRDPTLQIFMWDASNCQAAIMLRGLISNVTKVQNNISSDIIEKSLGDPNSGYPVDSKSHREI